MKRRGNYLIAGLGCTILVGCYQKVSNSDGIVFSFQPWVPLLAILAGLAVVAAGIILYVCKQRV